MQIHIGTGGYTDPDLIGHLYPQKAKKSDFLAHYANHFDTVEINSTFYAPIGQKAFLGMLNKAAGKLLFSVKLHQDFSHNRTATPDHAAAFIAALAPIIADEKLACLLLQFAHEFDRTPDHRCYLARVSSWFADYPLVVELRHPSWHLPTVAESFAARRVIWCSVDYPNIGGLPPSCLLATHKTGYLRLHGKNLNWWDAKTAAERHHYCYGTREMDELADKISKFVGVWDRLFVYFENTTKGQAVGNIALLKDRLALRGLLAS